jgi:hypothetical protein
MRPASDDERAARRADGRDCGKHFAGAGESATVFSPDAGRAVQPDNIVAQVESCVVYGLGLALTERVSFKDGVPQQSNFYDYIVPRMKDIPQIHTKVISTDNHPTGVGQMATPLVTPAVCNAVPGFVTPQCCPSARKRHSRPERVCETRAADAIIV